MIVVSDTSPVSNLLQIEKLDLLRDIFGEVIIPPAVLLEIRALEHFGIDLSSFSTSDWIRVEQPKASEAVAGLRHNLDAGESEAIVLAVEMQADWILLDERQATKIAEEKGLHPIGLIGILIKAKEKGLIPAVVPLVEELRHKAGFWITDHLLARIRELVSE
ncbi:MAG: DUF3368 domain-containing protein [Saprospiraceae bacterium]|nr:DUF3368 domain-containing protein [Lewinellaceae bacterium]